MRHPCASAPDGASTEVPRLDASLPPELLLDGHPPRIAALGEGLRRIVLAAVPEAIERVRVGWHLIGYDIAAGRRTVFFAWIWPQVEHVHLGFPNGVLLDDPTGALAGRGVTKRARWFTLGAPEDLLDERLAAFTRAAADLARLDRGQLELRRLEREGWEAAGG